MIEALSYCREAIRKTKESSRISFWIASVDVPYAEPLRLIKHSQEEYQSTICLATHKKYGLHTKTCPLYFYLLRGVSLAQSVTR